MWTPRGVIALFDRWRSRMTTLIVSDTANGSATTTLPSGTRSVSPDLAFALVIANSNIELHALGAAVEPRVLGRLQPGRNVVETAWSPYTNRLALLVGPASDPRLQIYEIATGDSFEVSFRGRTNIGSILWHGDDRLLYSEDGIWSLLLPREPHTITGARELPEPAERRVATGDRAEHFELVASNGTQVLARRVATNTELVRVRDGDKEVLPIAADLVRVKGMTRDNARIALECASDVGIVTWKSQAYTRVGNVDDVIAADGDRILLVQGNELFEVSDHDRRRVTTLPASTDRRILACAPTGGTCALVSWGGATPELRLLHGDELGPPLGVTVSYRISDVAVSPDGKQLAFAGGGTSSIDIVDMSTGAVKTAPLPADWACTGTTLVGWSSGGALVASQSCQGGLSRLVERAADGKTRMVFEGEGTITGFTLSKRDVYMNLRHDASELVVIDKL
jgi:WD40 repeat protein